MKKNYASPTARHVDMQAEEHFLAGSTPASWTRKKDALHDEEGDVDEFDTHLEDSLRTGFWY